MTRLEAIQRRLHAIRQAGGNGIIIIDRNGVEALLVTMSPDPEAAATNVFRRAHQVAKTRKPATA